ncbi:hypothetical protein D5S17_34335 [Pseudonocardiaceae bacterium YIM PH 21723]|nr:hypothetical protein D5S17_34335 [Pseudonocardiaceae bacterium YIM PH 21723]
MGFKGAAIALFTVAGVVATSGTAEAAALPSYEQWQADVKQVMDPAIPWLEQRVAQGGENLAIVLDIDNTSLETEYHKGEPNKPVLAVARWAKDHDMAVLFVTARSFSGKARGDLAKAGYEVDEICTRGLIERFGKAKARCRKDLAEQGYTITANIGNRDTDFQGGGFEKEYKLPDYDGELS